MLKKENLFFTIFNCKIILLQQESQHIRNSYKMMKQKQHQAILQYCPSSRLLCYGYFQLVIFQFNILTVIIDLIAQPHMIIITPTCQFQTQILTASSNIWSCYVQTYVKNFSLLYKDTFANVHFMVTIDMTFTS